MSALGHKRTLAHVRVMSALPPKADWPDKVAREHRARVCNRVTRLRQSQKRRLSREVNISFCDAFAFSAPKTPNVSSLRVMEDDHL
jgi:hypothetical protein